MVIVYFCKRRFMKIYMCDKYLSGKCRNGTCQHALRHEENCHCMDPFCDHMGDNVTCVLQNIIEDNVMKKCPFCHSDAEVVELVDVDGDYPLDEPPVFKPCCTNIQCILRKGTVMRYRSIEDAVYAWNTRKENI